MRGRAIEKQNAAEARIFTCLALRLSRCRQRWDSGRTTSESHPGVQQAVSSPLASKRWSLDPTPLSLPLQTSSPAPPPLRDSASSNSTSSLDLDNALPCTSAKTRQWGRPDLGHSQECLNPPASRRRVPDGPRTPAARSVGHRPSTWPSWSGKANACFHQRRTDGVCVHGLAAIRCSSFGPAKWARALHDLA